MGHAAESGEHASLLGRARTILSDYAVAADPVEVLCSTGPDYADRAERHLQRLHRALDCDDARFDDAVEAFLEMTVDVMRMQARYYRTGEIDGGHRRAGNHALYEDPDLMGRRYLCGLYLAQIFWPNHLEKLRYFEDVILPLTTDGARVLEIGAGPGTYGLSVGRSVDCAELTFNDISPLSIDLIQRMAAVDPVRRPDSVHYDTSDFLDLDTAGVEPFDLVLFSEILEHLVDPPRGLQRLSELVAPGGAVFFATATNAAFYDHTIVFADVREIEDLLDRAGYHVSKSHTITAVSGPDGRDVVDYVALIRRVG